MRRIASLVFLILDGLLLAGSAALGFYAQAVDNPGAEPVPDALAGRALTRSSLGREAVAEIASLHNEGFPLVSGAVAVYGGGAATVWVAGAFLDPLASQMIGAMEVRIAQGHSPFTPTGVRTMPDGRSVHELTGMDQHHFYFQSGRRMVWLAADSALAETALSAVLKHYP